jgi:hypothetical protein
MARLFSLPRIMEPLTSLIDQCQSTRGKALVQARVRSKETLGEILDGVESIRRRIHCESRNLKVRSSGGQASVLLGQESGPFTQPISTGHAAHIVIFGVRPEDFPLLSNRLCAQPATVSGIRQGFMSTGRSYNPYNVG